MVQVFFDGLCQPINPGGIACYAFVVKDEGVTIHRDHGLAAEPFSNDATNNVAEYTALLRALEWLADNKLNSKAVRILSDSRLVVNQLNQKFKIRGRRIVPLYRRVKTLLESFPDVEIRWVTREENREADRLTNLAYDEVLRNNPAYRKRI